MNQLAKLRVLIVDDHSNWRDLFQELLEGKYEVTPAENYEKAAAALLSHQRNPFHVAIVDIRLDDAEPTNVQGIDIAKWLKKTSKYTNTIIVTGYPTVHTMREAFKDLDVFDYVEKYPESGKAFDHERFLDVVHKAASNAQRKKLPITCDRGKLCEALDKNSTDIDIRKLLHTMRRKYGQSGIRSYDELRGPTKWHKIDHLLEIWQTHGDLCEVCEIYRTEIRPNSTKFSKTLQSICPYDIIL